MAQPGMIDDERIKQLYARRVAERGLAGGECMAPEAILALVRREGSEEERLATLDHVMSCAACHREYEWLGAVDRAVIEAGPAAGAPGRSWRFVRPLALAASVIVAVGAVLVVRRILSEGPEPLRGNGADIVLVSPPVEVPAGAPLDFAWRRADGVNRYVLEVQRADGSVVFTQTTADTSVTLREPAGVLPESDYRWWVREVTDGSEPRASPFRSLRLRR